MKKIITMVLTLIVSQFCLTQDEREVGFNMIADRMRFPEGPAWDGKGNLYVSSCYGGYITRVSKNEIVSFIDSSSNSNIKQTNGLTIYKDGNIFACDYWLGAILKIRPEGKSEIFIDGYKSKKFNRPTDL